jgi:Ca2+-binding RTX toxin-like protein
MAIFRNPNIDISHIDFSNLSVWRAGTSGADTLRGWSGRDAFNGYGSNDTFIGNGGVDSFNGGEGTDTVDYSNAPQHEANSAGRTGVIVDLQNNFGGEMGEASDSFTSIENVTGSNFNDGLFGDAGVNVLRGLGGDDNIMGGAGGDTLDGGQGRDTLFYTTSNAGVNVNLATNVASGGHATGDVISGFENVSGSEFADTLRGNGGDNVIEGDGGADTLDGAGGLNDTVSYSASNSGVTVNLANNTASGGDANGDIISNFENITGSRNADTLTGSFIANTIEGGGGNDIMTGNAGGDTFIFRGNSGQDHITDYNWLEDTLRIDVADGVTPTITWLDGADAFHVNVLIDFGNGSSVTLDNLNILLDAPFVYFETV